MEDRTVLARGTLEGISQRIIACAHAAAEALGAGLPAEDYEAELARALRRDKLQFAEQYPFGVPFAGPEDRGIRVDFVVECWTLVELKAVAEVAAEHLDLALDYLRESGAKLCLLINFGGPKVQVWRILPSGDVTHVE